jgi:hypothetical protein
MKILESLKSLARSGMPILAGAGLALGTLKAEAAPTNIVKTITANTTTTLTWGDEYSLNVQRAFLNGYVTGNPNGWYKPTQSVSLTAVPSNAVAKVFSYWSPGNQTNNPLVYVMSQPRTNDVPVFVPRQYTWTIVSSHDPTKVTIIPGTTSVPYGRIGTQTVSATSYDVSPGRRKVLESVVTTP